MYTVRMGRILPQSFYQRSALRVARELLGTFLVRRVGREVFARMITEVEAYDGFEDRASHASRGKTERNAVMFQEGGAWYVYFVYGMHEMLNVVVGEREYPAAVLIRGVEGISGPGRVTKFFGITRALNGCPATRESGLWVEDRGVIVPRSRIKTSPRIGVAYAGPVWAKKPCRFFLRKILRGSTS